MFEDVLDRIKSPENPQNERLACLFLLDISESMKETQKYEALIEGLNNFKTTVDETDEYIRKSLDVAIITFGPDIRKIQDFTPFSEFNIPILTPFGNCPLKEAIETGLDLLSNKKNEYRSLGIAYKRPWVFLISNGLPTDMNEGDANWVKLNTKIVSEEREKHFSFFAFGVSPQATEILQSLIQGSLIPATYIVEFNFRSFFSKGRGGIFYTEWLKIPKEGAHNFQLPPDIHIPR